MGVVQLWGGGQWPGENRTNKFEARKRIHLPRFSPPLGRARRAELSRRHQRDGQYESPRTADRLVAAGRRGRQHDIRA